VLTDLVLAGCVPVSSPVQELPRRRQRATEPVRSLKDTIRVCVREQPANDGDIRPSVEEDGGYQRQRRKEAAVHHDADHHAPLRQPMPSPSTQSNLETSKAGNGCHHQHVDHDALIADVRPRKVCSRERPEPLRFSGTFVPGSLCECPLTEASVRALTPLGAAPARARSSLHARARSLRRARPRPARPRARAARTRRGGACPSSRGRPSRS
jgi:hypothetical protein